MNIFHTSRLPTGLKQETLARMVRTLLLRLVDDNLGKQPEGEALLKVGVRQVVEDHFFVTRHTARCHVPSTRNTCDNGCVLHMCADACQVLTAGGPACHVGLVA